MRAGWAIAAAVLLVGTQGWAASAGAATASGGAATASAGAATPSPQVQAALQTLLAGGEAGAPQAGAMPAGGSAPRAAGTNESVLSPDASAGRATVVVQRGQSLDALIRLHLAASPLRVELLRDAVRQLNPAAFAPGPGYRLLAGARLQMPSREEQLRLAFGPTARLGGSPGEDGGANAAGHQGPMGGPAAAARRGWVRYP